MKYIWNVIKGGPLLTATCNFFALALSPCMKHLRDSSQERLALLEARLTEEKDWRKQLEADLSAAQAALRKDKEVKSAHIERYAAKLPKYVKLNY